MSKIENKHMESGEPIVYKYNTGHLIGCCDCGLTHLVFFDRAKTGVRVVMYRDDYQTNKERERHETGKKDSKK